MGAEAGKGIAGERTGDERSGNGDDAEEERVPQDEALRIVEDEAFAAVGEKIGRNGRRAGSRLGRQVALFSGLVYCRCGARCYRATSKNAKGGYSYYVCSRHQRYDDCNYDTRVREDALKKLVQDRFARAFSRVDEIIAGAIEVCRDAIRGNREAADRLNAEIAAADRELARFGALLVDPDVIAQPAAKRAMSGQMAAAQARRDELQRRLDDLRERAIDSAEAMADEVRKVFDDARRELADAATPEQDNRLVDHYLGPIEIQADGTPAQKQTPPAKTEGALQELHRGKHSMLVRKIEETRVISCWRRVLMFRSLKLPLTQRHFDWPHWGLCRR